MNAKVKADWPYPTIQACAGETFDKVTFSPVPADREAEALKNPYLEIEAAPVSVETPAAPLPTELDAPQPAKKARK